jgi:hypothetical protein
LSKLKSNKLNNGIKDIRTDKIINQQSAINSNKYSVAEMEKLGKEVIPDDKSNTNIERVLNAIKTLEPCADGDLVKYFADGEKPISNQQINQICHKQQKLNRIKRLKMPDGIIYNRIV